MRPGSMNGWNYAQGNPIEYTDPSGMVTCPSDLPTASRIYGEGAAAVATQYFGFNGTGVPGVWEGIEVAYNLDTMERTTFSVKGLVIARLTTISVGRVDYTSIGSGIGVPAYSVGDPRNDLGRDYGSVFINDCVGTAGNLSPLPVSFITALACRFHAQSADFSGISGGSFIGIDVGVPLVGMALAPVTKMVSLGSLIKPIPFSVSYSELNYVPDYSTYKLYDSVSQMAEDIRIGADSPTLSFINEDIAGLKSVLNATRVAVAEAFKLIQFQKGNIN